MSNKDNFITMLAQELKKRNNPDDFKSSIIGKVVNLEPITISISDGLALLKENKKFSSYSTQCEIFYKYRANAVQIGFATLPKKTIADCELRAKACFYSLTTLFKRH